VVGCRVEIRGWAGGAMCREGCPTSSSSWFVVKTCGRLYICVCLGSAAKKTRAILNLSVK
jgi:hypothetical protein